MFSSIQYATLDRGVFGDKNSLDLNADETPILVRRVNTTSLETTPLHTLASRGVGPLVPLALTGTLPMREKLFQG